MTCVQTVFIYGNKRFLLLVTVPRNKNKKNHNEKETTLRFFRQEKEMKCNYN